MWKEFKHQGRYLYLKNHVAWLSCFSYSNEFENHSLWSFLPWSPDAHLFVSLDLSFVHRAIWFGTHYWSLLFMNRLGNVIWAASWQKQQNDMCAQRRLRSAWASAQSDQSLCCALNGWLRTHAVFMRTAKTLNRLGECPGWSQSSLGRQSYCWYYHEAAHFIASKGFLRVVGRNDLGSLKSLIILIIFNKLKLCAQWVAKDPRFLHADSEDSEQTGRMPRLISVFAGRTVILLVLSWGGSFHCFQRISSCSWKERSRLT